MGAEAVCSPGTCEEARARASLAIDGELDDDVGARLLHRHLDGCPDCVRVVAEMRASSALLRRAPLEPLGRCLSRVRPRRAHAPARRLHGSAAVVAATALALGAASFHGADGLPTRAGGSSATLAAVAPPRLPLGQRSAVEDFAPAPPEPGAGARR